MEGLAGFDEPEIARLLLDRYASLHATDRPSAIAALASRKEWADLLLDHIASQRVSTTDLGAFHARQIAAFRDEALSAKLHKAWGRPDASDKHGQIAELQKVLTPEILAQANLSKGRQHVATLCLSCHKLYGEGGEIGPDLTGSGRANLEYLLENILDPSAVVSEDHRVSSLTLNDGRVVAGSIAAQNEKTITLRQPTGMVTVERASVEKLETFPLSLMPEGLLSTLQPEHIRDLIAYLMHPSQVDP